MGSNTPLHGLSEAEARRRLEAGGGNASPVSITKSAGQIIRENVCTLFNLFNVLIAIALALVGAWSNLLFILIIALNTTIGIVQELHAKKLVEQIAVLTAPKARVLRGTPLFGAVTTTAAGLLGMLPKGLVLLITVSLAVGVAKLAKSRVLVQNLFSLESLAHVDVLCLDKTGTLTQGDMRVERVEQLTKDLPVPLADWMGAFLTHIDDNNATFQAMRACFPNRDIPQTPTGKIPFSSQRKWSAVTFPELGTLVVGAPDRMTGTRLPEELSAEIRRGKRVLMIASTSCPVDPDGPLPEMTALAALVLSDPIRPGAAHTLDYFRREGVRIKVISGDHPAAAAAVAAQAGLEDASWVDMSQVNTEDELLRAAQQYTVFGRVSPEQKRQLVQAFQDQGHRVAMTGDGVNDILAMRKADCSIAMSHGSEAAQQAAQVVLLDSDFTVLPNILLEGRRVVNNMTRVAGVFFVKTIYSILLSLFCVLADLPFPLIPIQVTLIDLFIEGYPAFFQSFVPDGRALTGRFLPCVLRRSLPNAMAILLSSAALLLGGGVLGLPAGQIPLALYLVIGAVEVDALLKSCLPLTSLRGFLFLTASVGFFCAVLLFHAVLSLPPLLPETVPVVLLVSAVSILAERLCAFILCHVPRRDRAAEHLGPPILKA